MARRFRYVRDGVFLVAFFGMLLLIAAKLDPAADAVMAGPFDVIDGDTLSSGPERLRLEGIDAPELGQLCRDGNGEPWACGKQARGQLVRLMQGDAVECRGQEHDRYRRLLVRCQSGSRDINGLMVRQGFAVAAGGYTDEEASARSARLGIWAGTFDTPRNWRASRDMMDDAGFLEPLLEWVKQIAGWGRA